MAIKIYFDNTPVLFSFVEANKRRKVIISVGKKLFRLTGSSVCYLGLDRKWVALDCKVADDLFDSKVDFYVHVFISSFTSSNQIGICMENLITVLLKEWLVFGTYMPEWLPKSTVYYYTFKTNKLACDKGTYKFPNSLEGVAQFDITSFFDEVDNFRNSVYKIDKEGYAKVAINDTNALKWSRVVNILNEAYKNDTVICIDRADNTCITVKELVEGRDVCSKCKKVLPSIWIKGDHGQDLPPHQVYRAYITQTPVHLCGGETQVSPFFKGELSDGRIYNKDNFMPTLLK